MHITALIGDYTYSRPFAEVARELKDTFNGEVELTSYFCVRHQAFSQEKLKTMEESISRSEILLLCMVFDQAVLAIIKKYTNTGKTLLILASEGEGMKMARLGRFCVGDLIDSFTDSKIAKVFSVLRGLAGRNSSREVRTLLTMADNILKVLRFGKWKDAYNYVQAWKYFFNGGKENIRNLFLSILAEYYQFSVTYKPPSSIPDSYIAHPRSQKLFTSAHEYLAWYDLPQWMPTGNGKKKPMVGILFYNQRYQSNDTADLNAVIDTLEARGIGVMPLISVGTEKTKMFKEFFMTDNGPRIEALISFLFFRLEGGPLGGDYETFEQLCKQMNIPIINYIYSGYSTQEEWREHQEGLYPMETTLAIALPELDGQIEGIFVAAHQDLSKGKELVRVVSPIEERVEKAVNRTHNWLKLKYKPNQDKKVAFVLFNYPPGKDTLGSAGNLDTFESLIQLLDRMRDEGYTVSGYPKTRHEFIRLITKKNLVNQSNWTSVAKVQVNSFKIPRAQYQQWFADLPASCQKDMRQTWGEPPGLIMADEHYLYVPGIQFGNIFIGFQPARGIHSDPSKTYHDSALPPHHQYVAFYRWLEQVFQADVLVHFGTHGTLEFLPGKQVALSERCFPDYLIGNLPHVYFYTCSNPSEAMIAKRRSYAVLVSYMTPPMIVSDLYGKFAELETDIHNYYYMQEQSPAQATALTQGILEKAKENNLIDIEAQDLDINSLYTSLNEMKGSMMTKGVHVMGRSLTGDELVDYVLGIVRFDRGDIHSLHRSLCSGYGVDWDEARQNPSRIMKDGKVLGVLCDEINAQARALLCDVVKEKADIKKAIKRRGAQKLSGENSKRLIETLEFAQERAQNLEQNQEIERMVQALNVEFIPPGMGGDPIRSPNVIPSGRNTYQFNPDLIPTQLACDRGIVIANQVIENYQKENAGRLPETAAVILWGFETMKTQGETVGEIFHLIGVRPKRTGLGTFVGAVPVPLEELGRPRLDCMVEICGIFRDTFPVLVRYIDRAFRMVAALNEPEDKNFVRKHARAIQQSLEHGGMSRDKAESLSRARVFGPSASTYGTSVTDLIETSEWENDDQIGDLHIAKMAHVYGDIYHAFTSESAFREVLDTVDVVSQVRNSEEYGVADLDHYYEFLGGLSKSVEVVKKARAQHSGEKWRKPLILVADSTRDNIKTMDIKKTIDYEVRTKLLNPQWMKGQMESGYRGVKNLGKRVEHLLGWQATAGSVDNWVWSDVAGTYLFDEAVRTQMMQENIWAVEDQLKRLMEAYQRGMWNATDEEIEKLKQIYLEIEAEIEEQEE
jgi:cobaltochelatase CobN